MTTGINVKRAADVKAGLHALKRDIDKKIIQSVVDKYENQEGEYLFLCAEKL